MNRTIHFVEIGREQDKLIIFIHGTPGSWQAFANYLDDADLSSKARMIGVDRPGFGNSGAGKLVPSLSRQGLMLSPLLDLSPNKCGAILVGHSLGAPLAVRMAMDYPDKVGALVLIAPSLDPVLESPRWYNRLAEYKVLKWMIPSQLLLANDEVMVLQNELEEMLPLWDSLDLPVTVIQGQKDNLVNPANADFAERMLANGLKTVRVPKAGHFVLWKQPGLIKSELLEMLDSRTCNAGEQDYLSGRG